MSFGPGMLYLGAPKLEAMLLADEFKRMLGGLGTGSLCVFLAVVGQNAFHLDVQAQGFGHDLLQGSGEKGPYASLPTVG